ncbi:MAG TPA: alpha/beta hydrolase-fold protein [Minicystis sp.]|nr:alpha/beta hydrolase-fold protein [Minicystis sp.]
MSNARLRCLLVAAALASVAACHRAPSSKAKKLGRHAAARAAHAPRPPRPPQAADGSYTVDGLRYLELVTGGARSEDPLPMVVAMHGHGQSPVHFVHHFEQDTARARYIVPFGPTALNDGGYEWFPRVATTPARELAAIVPGVAHNVASAIQQILRVRPTVGKPVVVGFSQGAVMSYALAFFHGNMFSVACSMSGELPWPIFRASSAAPGPRPEVHGFHGDEDDVVKLKDDQHTIAELKRDGFAADLKVFAGVSHRLEPALADVLRCVDRGVAEQAGAAPDATPARSR